MPGRHAEPVALPRRVEQVGGVGRADTDETVAGPAVDDTSGFVVGCEGFGLCEQVCRGHGFMVSNFPPRVNPLREETFRSILPCMTDVQESDLTDGVSLSSETRRQLRRIRKSIERDFEERDRAIRTASEQGGSTREIGAEIGLSHVAVRNILNRPPGDETAPRNR
jgi:hypothetical protein